MTRHSLFARCLMLCGLLAIVTLAGCHILVHDDDQGESRGGWWHYCDATGCYRCTKNGCALPDSFCTTNSQCPEGLVCGSDGLCSTPSTACTTTSQCKSGQVCQSGKCVPGPTGGSCSNNASCGAGACCNNGTCQNTGLCKTNADCSKHGSNYICDTRGSCVVGAPVDPLPACSKASQCGSGLCLNSECATCSGDCGGAKTCQLDAHCGSGRRCLDGQCTASCTETSDCGSGQVCKSKVCVAGNVAGSGLVGSSCKASSDCGGSLACFNGTCLATCTATSTCANNKDICGTALKLKTGDVRLCSPDHTARLECKLTKDCANGETCVSGICRTTCTKAVDCANCNDGPVCGAGGFCMTEKEQTAACTLSSQCKDGKQCLGGECVTL